MDDSPSAQAGGWGAAAAAVAALAFVAPLLAAGSSSVVLSLAVFVFVLLLPLAAGAFALARGRVGVEPAPLVARLAGRPGAALPARAALIPAVAVGVAVGALAYNLLVSPLFAVLLGNAPPRASPVFLSGAQFVVLNAVTITEEIAFRLCALFLLAGLFGARAAAEGDRTPGARAWAAIIASGLLFGLFHVVNASYYGYPLGPFVLFSLLSQGVTGIFLGYVGWRFGVEASWLTHLTFNLFAFHLARLVLGAAG